ncbi:hypothetical protein C8R43DRAFT_1102455 [Mycena crocata]|nr:hypothetical protein C8R43DRAFT_1102455 [Mycena crocata]
MPAQAQVPQLRESVNRLPLRLRPVARAAAAGFRKDIRRLLDLGPESQNILLFPSFFPHLHPREIPNVDQLPTLAENNTAIENAVDSLTYLGMLQIPADIASTIWDRSWPWMEFLHTYWAHIPWLECRTEETLYSTFLLLLGRLRKSPDLEAIIRQTSGVHVVISRAWKLLLFETADYTHHDSALHTVCDFLLGTVHIPHESRMLLLEEFSDAEAAIYQKATINAFPLMLDFFNLHFRQPRASPLIREAIQAGFVPAIVALGTHTGAGEEAFIQLIYILQPYTVFYSVLSCLGPALASVKDLCTQPDFVRSRIFPVWTDFWNLAQARIAVMEHYHSDAAATFIVDEVLCGAPLAEDHITAPNNARRRTGKTGTAISVALCRRSAWVNPSSYRTSSENNNITEAPEHLSARDRSFLRALMTRDYKIKQLEFLQHEVELSKTFPNESPCLGFDYRNGPLGFYFTQLSQMSEKWPDEVDRAMRSDGRRKLHFVELPNGVPTEDDTLPIPCTRLFPLQASSSVLADGLHGLTTELRNQVDGSTLPSELIQDMISALIQAGEPHLLQDMIMNLRKYV